MGIERLWKRKLHEHCPRNICIDAEHCKAAAAESTGVALLSERPSNFAVIGFRRLWKRKSHSIRIDNEEEDDGDDEAAAAESGCATNTAAAAVALFSDTNERAAAAAAAVGGAEQQQLLYRAKLPWHSGARAALCAAFPRYGNYCGPNYSSGRNSGSPVWDASPIDALDACCFCHDVAYDTHCPRRLLRADNAFLRCVRSIASNSSDRKTKKKKQNFKGSVWGLYRAAYARLCVFGLTRLLIPYHRWLVKQHGPCNKQLKCQPL